MNDAPQTLMEFLNAARDYLRSKGVDNPRGDAEALLGQALGLPRLQLYLQHDRPLRPEEVMRYRALIARRGKREPLQLIVGSVEFCGVQINVSPGLLIPRPETEQLATTVIEWAATQDERFLKILDIGTGTGCLAVAIAAAVPHAHVDAVDTDFGALQCALGNAERNGVADRVHVNSADVLDTRFLTSVQPPYDVVVSNPPYVSEADYASLAPEVRDHESKRALIGGDDGLLYYRHISGLLSALLQWNGFFAIEIGVGQEDAVPEILYGQTESLAVHKDLSGIPRIVTGRPRSNPVPRAASC